MSIDPERTGDGYLPEHIHSKEIARFADAAMYVAEPDRMANQGLEVLPQVTLIHQTANPLRVMAAAAELYRGRVVRDPDDVSEEEALAWFGDMTKTALKAPLEFIDFHFLIEGVTRAFTHQLVRQRTAVYVQESQRFAVKEHTRWEVSLPPSIAELKYDDPRRVNWDLAIQHISNTYKNLINAGTPAEDARGLLPTNITTRVHYKTNLRGLAEHAGLRLCSQAQHEWKQVWAQMIQAIKNYGPFSHRWQQKAITDLFKPVCYQTGRCEFRAATDRYCSIRERVEAHYAKGEGPEQWTNISPLEPLLATAARQRPQSTT